MTVKKGIRTKMRVEFQPIKTIGLPFFRKRYVALTQSRRVVFTEDWPFTVPDGTRCVIPAGYGPGDDMLPECFDTDGSSYPRITRIVFDPWGVSVGAGIPHDFAYRFRCLLKEDGGLYMEGVTRFEADDLFKRLNLQINDIPELAYSTHAALRIFGPPAWNQHRANDGSPRNNVALYQALRDEIHES